MTDKPFREVVIVCECGGRVEPNGNLVVCTKCKRAVAGLRVQVLDPTREYMREVRDARSAP